VYRIFPVKKAKKRAYLCKETLYVSDTSTESHYHVNHEKNKGIIFMTQSKLLMLY
jgi:hypothetical protein